MKSIEIDRTKLLRDQPATGHNRLHPDIPPILEVDEGEEVVLETRDGCDGYLGPSATAASIRSIASATRSAFLLFWSRLPFLLQASSSIVSGPTRLASFYWDGFPNSSVMRLKAHRPNFSRIGAFYSSESAGGGRRSTAKPELT